MFGQLIATYLLPGTDSRDCFLMRWDQIFHTALESTVGFVCFFSCVGSRLEGAAPGAWSLVPAPFCAHRTHEEHSTRLLGPIASSRAKLSAKSLHTAQLQRQAGSLLPSQVQQAAGVPSIALLHSLLCFISCLMVIIPCITQCFEKYSKN